MAQPPLLVLTGLLAVACGKLYVRYLHDGRDRLAWAVVVTYGGVCLMAALVRSFRPAPVPGDEVGR